VTSDQPSVAAPALHLPSWRTPLVSVVAAGALLAGGLADLPWLWIPVVALQVALVVTWHRSLGAPSAATGAAVGGGLALIADVVVATTDDAPSLGPVVVVLGAGYLIAVVQQLVRTDGRERLVDSLAATVSLATIAALGVSWVVMAQLSDEASSVALLSDTGAQSAVVVLAGASVAAAVGRLAPGIVGAAVAPVLAGAVAGWLLGAAADDAWLGLGLGVAAGVPAALAATMQFRVGADAGGPADAGWGGGWVVSALWPVLFAGALGYVALRVLT
jgi:hypothetical protein